MYSAQILKASLHEALSSAFPIGSDIQYLPLGVDGGVQKSFTITDEYPASPADLTVNQARVTIDGPRSGDFADSTNYVRTTLQINAFALAKPDAGFLIEYIAHWLPCLTRTDMPMVGQNLDRVNVTRHSGPALVKRLQVNAASLDAVFHLTVN